MASARDDAIAKMEAHIVSSQELRAHLRHHESVCRRLQKCLESESDLHTALQAIESDQWREELTSSLDEFEHRRHVARLALIAVGLNQGMSIGEVGRSWGFSRQLAARLAREAKPEP
jgi:hypothetical protein